MTTRTGPTSCAISNPRNPGHTWTTTNRRSAPPSVTDGGGPGPWHRALECFPVSERSSSRGAHSAAGRCFELLGVARALDGDGGCRMFDFGEIARRQFDIRRAKVLLEPVQLRGAGDRDDPRLLRKQPCDRNLRGRG